MAKLVLWDDEALRVTAAGVWLHGGEPLHPRVQRLFARHLFWRPGEGYSIRIRADRQPLKVEDTALHVLACHVVTGAGQHAPFAGAELTFSHGERQLCDVGRLYQSPGHVLYTQVVAGGLRLPCRFVPQAYYSLAVHFTPGDDGSFRLAGRPLQLLPGAPEVEVL